MDAFPCNHFAGEVFAAAKLQPTIVLLELLYVPSYLNTGALRKLFDMNYDPAHVCPAAETSQSACPGGCANPAFHQGV